MYAIIPTPGPCTDMTCPSTSKCVVSNMTGHAKCIPDCQVGNGGCPDTQDCEIRSIGCASSNKGPCDFSFYRKCKDPSYGNVYGINSFGGILPLIGGNFMTYNNITMCSAM